MILITGAAGFIGSNIIRELNTRGREDLILCDALGSDSKWKNLVDLQYADYVDRDDLFSYLAAASAPRLSAVLHMGACSDTTEPDAHFLMKNNFEFSKSLAIYCLERSVRFIYASSAATYGNGENGYNDEADIDTLRPLNMYGYSKQLFDQWLLRRGDLEKVVGLKFFNVYGPYEFHKGDMRSLVQKAYEQINETGKLRLFKSTVPEYKDGGQMRDFVYVKDAVKQTLFFLDNSIGGLYNVGTGKAHSWNELAAAIFSAMQKKLDIEYFDMPEKLAKQYQNFTQATREKLSRVGYDDPCFSLQEAINDYVQFLDKNHTL